jgi:hypothetical protein
MAWIIGRGKEYEITGLQIAEGYRFPLSQLGRCCKGQIDIKGIPVNRFHKPGAINAFTFVSTQLMAGAFPTLIFFKNVFLRSCKIYLPCDPISAFTASAPLRTSGSVAPGTILTTAPL